MNDRDLEFHIAKLDLAPGDILVVKTDKPLTREAAQGIRETFKRIMPSGANKTLIIEPGIELSKLTQSEIAERAA